MRSIGAVKVLATAPDTPPNTKSTANFDASGIASTKNKKTKKQKTKQKNNTL